MDLVATYAHTCSKAVGGSGAAPTGCRRWLSGEATGLLGMTDRNSHAGSGILQVDPHRRGPSDGDDYVITQVRKVFIPNGHDAHVIVLANCTKTDSAAGAKGVNNPVLDRIAFACLGLGKRVARTRGVSGLKAQAHLGTSSFEGLSRNRLGTCWAKKARVLR